MNSSRKSIALALLLALFASALLGDIFLTIYFLDSRRAGLGIFVAIGLLVSQPCLLSIWCALGAQHPVWRMPTSMGMLAVLTVAYSLVLRNDGAPLEIFLIVGGIAIAITLTVQIPLWIFRAKSKHALALPSDRAHRLGSNQFAIKHLLIITTIAAVIVAVAQANLPENFRLRPGSGPPWFSLILFVSFFIVSSCLITLLVVAAIFSQRLRIPFLFLLMLVLLTCPLGAIAMMKRSGLFARAGITWNLEATFNTYAVIWATCIGLAAVLLMFYLIGFRLVKSSDRIG